jgi:hypothetical protein
MVVQLAKTSSFHPLKIRSHKYILFLFPSPLDRSITFFKCFGQRDTNLIQNYTSGYAIVTVNDGLLMAFATMDEKHW